MRCLCVRLWLSLATGYILFYYGEMIFWATPDREGIGFVNGAMTWLIYSIIGFAFLCVVSIFRARNFWAVFLAGACFGWFVEGIFVQTMYGIPETPFPMSISFTGLAWHTLISVVVGWFFMRKALAEVSLWPTTAVAGLLGIFYGLWAVFWWTEPPEAMASLIDAGRKDLLLFNFSVFSVVTNGFLIVAHWAYNRFASYQFRPSRIELGILGAVFLLYYAFVTVPAVPRALWVLPPLLGLTFWALHCNRQMESRPDAITAFHAPISALKYGCLLLIPGVAIVIYAVALAADASLRTNMVVYYVSSALGAALWIMSIVVLTTKRYGHNYSTTT